MPGEPPPLVAAWVIPAGDRANRLATIQRPKDASKVDLNALVSKGGSAALHQVLASAPDWSEHQILAFRGERYAGEHEAIIESALFDEVQRGLDAKPCGRGHRRCRNPAFLLQGLLRCGLCSGPMTTASARGRGGATFRYYLCRHP